MMGAKEIALKYAGVCEERDRYKAALEELRTACMVLLGALEHDPYSSDIARDMADLERVLQKTAEL